MWMKARENIDFSQIFVDLKIENRVEKWRGDGKKMEKEIRMFE